MSKLIEEMRETRVRELEKRELENHAREERDRQEEQHRWKGIDDAQVELIKEKDLLNEEKEKVRLAELKNAKDKEDFQKMAKIWKDEYEKKKEEVLKKEQHYVAKLHELTVEQEKLNDQRDKIKTE